MFPPRPAYRTEIVDAYLAEGWRYWYSLHNHTRRANGTLGVSVPSTSDVRVVDAGPARRDIVRSDLLNVA